MPPCQSNQVLLRKPPDMRVVVAEEVVVQARFFPHLSIRSLRKRLWTMLLSLQVIMRHANIMYPTT